MKNIVVFTYPRTGSKLFCSNIMHCLHDQGYSYLDEIFSVRFPDSKGYYSDRAYSDLIEEKKLQITEPFVAKVFANNTCRAPKLLHWINNPNNRVICLYRENGLEAVLSELAARRIQRWDDNHDIKPPKMVIYLEEFTKSYYRSIVNYRLFKEAIHEYEEISYEELADNNIAALKRLGFESSFPFQPRCKKVRLSDPDNFQNYDTIVNWYNGMEALLNA